MRLRGIRGGPAEQGFLLFKPPPHVPAAGSEVLIASIHQGRAIRVTDNRGLGKDLIPPSMIPMEMGVDDVGEIRPFELPLDDRPHLPGRAGKAGIVHDDQALFRGDGRDVVAHDIFPEDQDPVAQADDFDRDLLLDLGPYRGGEEEHEDERPKSLERSHRRRGG